jgi:hypothetical protein
VALAFLTWASAACGGTNLTTEQIVGLQLGRQPRLSTTLARLGTSGTSSSGPVITALGLRFYARVMRPTSTVSVRRSACDAVQLALK